MTSLSKFKLEEQLCFAAKLNILHIHRLQAAVSAIVKYIEDNSLNQYVKKVMYKSYPINNLKRFPIPTFKRCPIPNFKRDTILQYKL